MKTFVAILVVLLMIFTFEATAAGDVAANAGHAACAAGKTEVAETEKSQEAEGSEEAEKSEEAEESEKAEESEEAEKSQEAG